MTFSPSRAAASLTKALDAMELAYWTHASGVSESRYVTTSDIKIRFSRHEAKPTYERLNGAAQCEIGPYGMAAGTDWKRALAYICYQLDATPPARYAKYCAAYSADRIAQTDQLIRMASPEYQAERAILIEARRREDQNRRAADWLVTAPHVAAINEFDRRVTTGDLVGKRRKAQRQAARKALIELIGLPENRFREALWAKPIA